MTVDTKFHLPYIYFCFCLLSCDTVLNLVYAALRILIPYAYPKW